MQWRAGRRSTNVEDRRGSGTRVAAGGGIITILAAVVWALMGGDPTPFLGQPGTTLPPEEEQELADFSSAVLAQTEDVWKDIFAQQGRTYVEPKLVLFTGGVDSACGFAQAAVGPFYCPADQQLYLDLSFFSDLTNRFGAPGDFARAYVIAHEVGHHVQTLLGTSERVRRAQRGASQTDANALSVRLELQADFYAGVWAHHAQRSLDEGDLEEALDAAAAIGDDRLQREAGGRVVPDSFTHGTSEQRRSWFLRGFKTGDLSRGDTFDDAEFAATAPR
jgi:predicted metalloprotease